MQLMKLTVNYVVTSVSLGQHSCCNEHIKLWPKCPNRSKYSFAQ